MTRFDSDGVDAFLEDILDVPEAGIGLASVTGALPAAALSASLRDRILRSAQPEDRLARFAEPIAALLDTDLDSARAMLARIDDSSAWFELLPGISLLPVDGGPSVRHALRGFVRVRAGTEFPVHEHLGEESVMIMQGYYADAVSGAVFGPGDTPVHPRDSSHGFRVLADGPDLLGLVVAHGGLRADGREFRPL